MSARELRRAEVLGRVKGQTLRLVDAAKMLEVSYRQAKRLWQRYRDLCCVPARIRIRYAGEVAEVGTHLLRSAVLAGGLSYKTSFPIA